VIPTNLVALQEKGVALTDVGLPCGEDCKDEKNPFTKSDAVLGGDTPIKII
jgi:hypothetical protein